MTDLVTRCDKCLSILSHDNSYTVGKDVLCVDCYLRLHGYNPAEIAGHFSDFTLRAIAQLEQRKAADLIAATIPEAVAPEGEIGIDALAQNNKKAAR